MARVPLSPPPVPVFSRTAWPAPAVAVFGRDERALAEALLETWPVKRIEVRLRHRPGWEHRDVQGGLRLIAHPEALPAALAQVAEAHPTVGIGAGFAAAVATEHVVYSGGATSLLTLDPSLRPIVRHATLQLEHARLDTMRALGRLLSGA